MLPNRLYPPYRNQTYLGDGVYACQDEYGQIWLGLAADSYQIALNAEEMLNLLEYSLRVGIITKERVS